MKIQSTERPAKETTETSSKMLTETCQYAWDSKSKVLRTTQKKTKAWKKEEEDDSSTTMLTMTCHCVWEKLKGKATTTAAAMKVGETIKVKWRTEAKIYVTIRQERETMKKKLTKMLRLSKNMRSISSSERIEEIVYELGDYRLNTILLSETWRHDKAEIWETHYKNIFIWSGKYDKNTTLLSYWTKSGSKE